MSTTIGFVDAQEPPEVPELPEAPDVPETPDTPNLDDIPDVHACGLAVSGAATLQQLLGMEVPEAPAAPALADVYATLEDAYAALEDAYAAADDPAGAAPSVTVPDVPEAPGPIGPPTCPEGEAARGAVLAEAHNAMLGGPLIVWTNLNMGAESGLDADTVDGLHAGDLLAAVDDEAAARAAGDAALAAHIRNGNFLGRSLVLDDAEVHHFFSTPENAREVTTGSRAVFIDSDNDQDNAFFEIQSNHGCYCGGRVLQFRVTEQDGLYAQKIRTGPIMADSLTLSGAATAASFRGDGSGLTNVDAATLAGRTASAFEAADAALDQRTGDIEQFFVGNRLKVGAFSLWRGSDSIYSEFGNDGGARFIASGGTTFFIDSDNDEGNAAFAVHSNRGCFCSPQVKLFSVTEANGLWAREITSSGHIYAHSSSHIGDAAEPVAGVGLEAGDVVVMDGRDADGKLKVKRSDGALDTTVAGVISTDPSLMLAGVALDTPMAVTGQVPVKVVGAVAVGDLLVSSEVAGHARACTEGPACWGAVIGEATEAFDGVAQSGRVIALVTLS